MKNCITLLMFVISAISYSQQTDIEKMKNDIKDIQKQLNNEQIENIGTLNFKLKNINFYTKEKKYEKKYEKSIELKKIELAIIDGCIVNIKVYDNDNNVYYNHDASIAITVSRFKKVDYLFLGKSNECIVFQELLDNPKFEPFTPKDDENVLIDKDHLTYELNKDVSLNGLLDTRIYTDALGFFGGEKNSILQTEVKSKFILNRNNIKNFQTIPLSYFNINVNYNKIDSKFKFVNSANYENSDLIQKSFFNAEVGLNIFKSNLSKNNSKITLFSDLGTTFSWNKFIKNTDTLSVKNISFFVETGIKTKLYNHLGLNAGVRLIRLMSPETKEFNQDLSSQYFNFIKFNLDLFYLLDDKKSDRLFFKFNYFKSTNNDLTNNQFPQIQVGYSKLFTKLFSK